MKKIKIIYWASTGILSVFMAYSAFLYLTEPGLKAAFAHLGFPDYFRIELGIAKGLGALALILSFIPKQVKQLAYAGFLFTFISAAIAHAASGDPAQAIGMPLVFLGVLVISNVYWNKLQNPVENGIALTNEIHPTSNTSGNVIRKSRKPQPTEF